MIQENEIITLILYAALIVFYVFNVRKLNLFPEKKIFMFSVLILFFSVVFTVAEGYFWENELNFLEHLFKALSALLLVFWTLSLISKRRKAE